VKLNICGRKYTVKRGDIPGNFGLCDCNKATITIAEDLEVHTDIPPETILLHEIIHAVLYETGLTNALKDRIEESIVHALALQLSRIGYSLLKPLPADLSNGGHE
jgi:hypothetical protein